MSFQVIEVVFEALFLKGTYLFAIYYYVSCSSELKADIPFKVWKTLGTTAVLYVLPTTNLAYLEKILSHSLSCIL